jgi:hypothetical protein
MKITIQEKPTDPVYPKMHGDSPTAKEFNKRCKTLWAKGDVKSFDFNHLVTTILLEILIEDYDRRHAPRNKTKK